MSVTDAKRTRYLMLRSWFDEMKSEMKCVICKEGMSQCLDFHHLDPAEKEHPIAKMVNQGYGKDAIMGEIEKCIVLCSNHHRLWHYEEELLS